MFMNSHVDSATWITFGRGKSAVYKNFMEALICHKNEFIHFSTDVAQATIEELHVACKKGDKLSSKGNKF